MKNELIDQILKAFPNLEYDNLRHSLDKYHADKCREQEHEEARINAEHYGNLSPNMPPCMMPDGGECCKEYADLNRAYNELKHVADELADKLQTLYNSTCFGGTHIEELDAALDALQSYGTFFK